MRCGVTVDPRRFQRVDRLFQGAVTPQTEKLDSLLGQQPLAIGDLILAEVLQGFDDPRDFDVARKMLTLLMVVDLGGREIAIQAAKTTGCCAGWV